MKESLTFLQGEAQNVNLFMIRKVPILYNSLIISTYEIEKRKRVTIWLLLKFPELP